MRFSTLHVFVCLAAAAVASPTDMSVDSLQARNMWTSPARRDVFVKGDAIAKRESHEHELLARELEELAVHEEAQLEERNFEELRARYFDELAKREWKEFEARDIESREPLAFNGLSKRDPQFNIGSFITNLRTQLANGRFGANATANANTGTGNTGTGATTNANAGLGGFAGLGGGASARISSALSRLGFNFRRGEIDEVFALYGFPTGEDSLTISKRDPQFNIGSFITNLRAQIANGRFGANATANANTGAGNTGNTGTTTNANAGLGGFSGLGGGASARISSALSRLGFNFRRGEFDESSAEPFQLETFVKSKRSELV
ncbi:hypothetical protein PENSPDRAFT_747048 [Peniophora sp. CONT]|nr:hypothetical protein PENSPDRAFT_747048 [Peniophora sp. CONT]